MQDTLLTLREVAALLKVADKTVYTTAQRRELPGFKVCGQWRFKPADLDQWIEERKATERNAAKERGKAPTRKERHRWTIKWRRRSRKHHARLTPRPVF